MRKLFVYGTLRADHPNSVRFGLAGSCDLIRDVQLPGFDLYDLGAFPGIVPGAGTVTGDLFDVPEERFDALDSYEGTPYLYTRQTATVAGFEDVQIYVYNESLEGLTPIASGDWNNQKAG